MNIAQRAEICKHSKGIDAKRFKALLFTLPKRAIKRRRPGTIKSSRLKV